MNLKLASPVFLPDFRTGRSVGFRAPAQLAVEMIGISAFVLAAVSLAGFLIHWPIGATDWTITALLLGGTLSGAWLAPLLLDCIEAEKRENWFRPLVAGSLALAAIFLIRRLLF